jgi:hypothetical protein
MRASVEVELPLQRKSIHAMNSLFDVLPCRSRHPNTAFRGSRKDRASRCSTDGQVSVCASSTWPQLAPATLRPENADDSAEGGEWAYDLLMASAGAASNQHSRASADSGHRCFHGHRPVIREVAPRDLWGPKRLQSFQEQVIEGGIRIPAFSGMRDPLGGRQLTE